MYMALSTHSRSFRPLPLRRAWEALRSGVTEWRSLRAGRASGSPIRPQDRHRQPHRSRESSFRILHIEIPDHGSVYCVARELQMLRAVTWLTEHCWNLHSWTRVHSFDACTDLWLQHSDPLEWR